jgi:hypothetical protein
MLAAVKMRQTAKKRPLAGCLAAVWRPLEIFAAAILVSCKQAK